MKKRLRSSMAGVIVAGLSLGLVGCSQEASDQTTREIKGPGGTTTVTEQTKVKTTGENPPPAAPKNP